jgi:hypothetical protein
VSWLEFSERSVPAKQVTRHWVVGTKTGDYLGEVRWFPAWRKYAFTPSASSAVVWFEQDCLREIAQFIEDRTREHKKSRERAARP